MYNKFARAMRNLHKDERGMTGLETAIILIAFVTVAAVFGYAVLSAGLFSAERSKETIYAGLKSAQSNLELSGSVYATTHNATPDNLAHILITVKNAISGQPIDMTVCDGTPTSTNKTVISLSNGYDYINNVKWTRTPIGYANNNNLLETGEQFEIDIALDDLGTGKVLTHMIGVNDTFNVQIKPALGSTSTVKRNLPASLEAVMDLH
jgi:flagellin FlaB